VAPTLVTENRVGRIGARERAVAKGPGMLVAKNASDAGPDKASDCAASDSVPLMRAQ
jgi:hypothetical protein